MDFSSFCNSFQSDGTFYVKECQPLNRMYFKNKGLGWSADKCECDGKRIHKMKKDIDKWQQPENSNLKENENTNKVQ